MLYEAAYFEHQEALTQDHSYRATTVNFHLVAYVWFKIFTLAKADHLMSDHKKLKKENTKLQQENEKLQNNM